MTHKQKSSFEITPQAADTVQDEAESDDVALERVPRNDFAIMSG